MVSRIQTAVILVWLALCVLPAAPAEARSVAYTYDELGRLVQESYNNGTVINYSYDAAGNRLSKEVAISGGITLVSPNGGEHWKRGATETIQWTYGNQAGKTVKVELLKGGVLSTTIAASAPVGADGRGSLDWTVPAGQKLGTDYKVKVTSLSNSALTDSSRWNITVDGTSAIGITAPAAGAAWVVGSSAAINWTWSGDPPSSVRIELLKGGAVHTTLAESAPIGARGAGSFAWTIPAGQTPGKDYQVRLSTPVDGITSTSRNFAITGGIVVETPGTSQAGNTVSLRWKYDGDPGPAVMIELLKGNVVDSVIASSVPVGTGGSGSYPWPVPAAQTGGSDYRIRISSTSNNAYRDTSDASFTINPSAIQVYSPNGGEAYLTGTNHSITWHYQGTPGSTVKIELLKGGTVQSVIASSYPVGSSGYGSYSWDIPATLTAGEDYSLRIGSISNSTITDTSDGLFAINASSIRVSYPNGSEQLSAESTFAIRWSTSGNPGETVRIELIEGGAVQSVIASSVSAGSAGQGSYNWTVPTDQPGGTDYSIRVRSTSNGVCTDTSDGVFSIVPVGITLSSPNGWEAWQRGDTKTISWTYVGKIGAGVKVELLKGDVLHSTLAARTATGTRGKGSFSWAIPATLPSGNDYRVRVTGTGDSSYTATSVNPFSVLPTSFSISSPWSGEQLQAGKSYTISWTYTGAPGSTVNIALLKGGAVQSIIASSVATGSGGRGSCTWNIGANQAPGSDYRVRITSTSDAAYTGSNTSPFQILPAIQVVAPNGYDRLNAGTSCSIRWSFAGDPGSAVKIELLKGDAVQSVIAPGVPIGSAGQGSYDWTIPAGQPGGSDYRIQVTSLSAAVCTDMSDNTFTIVPSAIVVEEPYYYSDLVAGTTYEISWSYTGSPGPSVKIELLKGTTVQSVISSGCPIGSGGSGSYNWAIPAGQPGGEDFNIRITSTSNNTFTGTSDGPFTIIPTGVTLTRPYSGYTYQAGNTCEIAWQYTGAPGSTVKIELLKGGALHSVIASSCPIGLSGGGTYSWVIPGTLTGGGEYLVRVTSTTNSSWSDVNDAPFTINPSSITVNTPSGGQHQAGTVRNISWAYSGAPGSSVGISLYRGDAYQYTLANSVSIGSSNRGSYDWTIPAKLAPGDDYRVMVAGTSSSAIYGMSAYPFEVLPSHLELSSPSAGSSLRQGTTQNICWKYTGSPGSYVKIDLLKQGIVDSVIAAQAPIGSGGGGCYNWVVPSAQTAGTDYRVRVTSTSNRGYTDMNDGDFSIVAP